MFIALPATVGLIFIARPLVTSIFQYRAFDADDTTRVSGALVFYSLGLAAYFTQHLVVRTFYAMHESRTPARVAVKMVVLNLAMNLALVGPLEERGLALATAVCAVIQVVWLITKLRALVPSVPWSPVARSAIRSALGTVVMAGVLVLMNVSGLAKYLREIHAIAELLSLVTTGAIAYVVMARLLKSEELSLVLHRGRAAPPVSEP